MLPCSPWCAAVQVNIADYLRGGSHTSQFSKIKQRPPATDLSGPKASDELLTPRRTNLAEAVAVVVQSDSLSPLVALGPTLSSSAPGPSPPRSRSPLVTDRGGSEPDDPTPSPCPPALAFSVLRFFPVRRCLICFFILESDPRMSSMLMSCQRR